jgi:hypothetical protein
MEDLAILIHTCDKYQFAWEGWAYFFDSFWDFDFPAPIYFVNEEIDINFDLQKPIYQIKTGKGEFSTRLINALKKIEQKNVFYIQEDAWLFCKLNLNELYSNFKLLNMNNLRVCDDWLAVGSPNLLATIPDKIIHDYPLKQITHPDDFVFSHQPGFWKKEFLLKYLEPEEDPWKNEFLTSKRMINDYPEDIGKLNMFVLLKSWYHTTVSKGYFNQGGLTLINIIIKEHRKSLKKVGV